MGARAEYTNTAYGSERMGRPAQQGALRRFRPGASGVARPFARAHSFCSNSRSTGTTVAARVIRASCSGALRLGTAAKSRRTSWP